MSDYLFSQGARASLFNEGVRFLVQTEYRSAAVKLADVPAESRQHADRLALNNVVKMGAKSSAVYSLHENGRKELVRVYDWRDANSHFYSLQVSA